RPRRRLRAGPHSAHAGHASPAGSRTSGCIVSFPLPATASAEGAQFNVPPSLWERALSQGEGPRRCNPPLPHIHGTSHYTRQPAATVLPSRLFYWLILYLHQRLTPALTSALAAAWWRSSWHVVSRTYAASVWSCNALWPCLPSRMWSVMAWSTA